MIQRAAKDKNTDAVSESPERGLGLAHVKVEGEIIPFDPAYTNVNVVVGSNLFRRLQVAWRVVRYGQVNLTLPYSSIKYRGTPIQELLK